MTVYHQVGDRYPLVSLFQFGDCYVFKTKEFDYKESEKGMTDWFGNPIQKQKEVPCIIEQMTKEEMKKPVWLRNFAFHVVCRCPKCNRVYY